MPGYVVGPRGSLQTPAEANKESLDRIRSHSPAVAELTQKTVDAVVEDKRRIRSDWGSADLVDRGLINDVYEAVVEGNPSGGLIRKLRNYERDTWSPSVRSSARELASKLEPELKKVSMRVSLANGPFEMPLTIRVKGKDVQGRLVGTLKDLYLSNPRVKVGGSDYRITDEALTELLGRAGRNFDAEDSSQTKYFEGGLFGLFQRKAIHFDGKGFRPLTGADRDGRTVYYHDDYVKIVE